MARDLATAKTIVSVVVGRIMATSLGDVMMDRAEYFAALDDAVEAVADLLDPEEVFDVEIEVEDEPRHCPDCGETCDFRVQVCECGPGCPRIPIAR